MAFRMERALICLKRFRAVSIAETHPLYLSIDWIGVANVCLSVSWCYYWIPFGEFIGETDRSRPFVMGQLVLIEYNKILSRTLLFKNDRLLMKLTPLLFNCLSDPVFTLEDVFMKNQDYIILLSKIIFSIVLIWELNKIIFLMNFCLAHCVLDVLKKNEGSIKGNQRGVLCLMQINILHII